MLVEEYELLRQMKRYEYSGKVPLEFFDEAAVAATKLYESHSLPP